MFGRLARTAKFTAQTACIVAATNSAINYSRSDEPFTLYALNTVAMNDVVLANKTARTHLAQHLKRNPLQLALLMNSTRFICKAAQSDQVATFATQLDPAFSTMQADDALVLSKLLKQKVSLDAVKHSQHMQTIHDQLAKKSGSYYSTISIVADEENQKLAKEVQTTLGIDKQLPLFTLTEQPNTTSEGNTAFTCTSGIYLSPSFTQFSYGARRFMLFHEAIHHKYFDSIKFQSSSSQAAKDCDLERRADIQAAYHCACWKCVTIFAIHRPSVKDSSQPAINKLARGYLAKEQLYAIAQLHRDRKLLCKYHAENTDLFEEILRWIKY